MMRSLKKRFAAWLCTAAMVVTTLPMAFPVTAEAKLVKDLSAVSREVAADGCVLLKNENDALPLKKDAKISVFGRAQCNYYAAGNGSGGGVKTEYRVGILEGLEKSGMVKVNPDLKKEYSTFAGKNKDNSDEWGATPCSQVEMPMTQNIADNARKNYGDAAVVLLGRTSGEDSDMTFDKGSYRLTDEEDNMLKIVSDTFDKVIVVLNVTNIIDMSWVDKYPKIDSVVYAWNGGQEGGNGVADVLTGKVNPSGKLTDTIAKDKSDYPAGDNYGKYETYYTEDIYVGYRYFETFAQDRVQYPFGFGLSYTTFDTKFERATVENGYIKVVVTVTNTGDVTGREVVQVYYGAPQNGLGNPSKELAAFAKTNDIQPGKSETMSLNFKIKDMASYDDGGVYQESAYVLEKGDYKIYVGNDVRSSKEVYTYKQDKVEVVEQLTEAAAPIKDFKRLKAVEENGKVVKKEETVPKLKVNVEQKIKDNLPKELQKKDNGNYTLKDVYDGKVTVEQFVAQMTNEQMGMLAQGSCQVKESYTKGGASTFGGVAAKDNNGDKIIYLSDQYGIPVVVTADGPSGIRISDTATMIPCGNVIGCTWDLDLIERLLELEGQELMENDVDNLLGPGVNIHRDPRCGRNFEYFSEDPLLSGRIAAVMVKGAHKSGATLTAKHFACNNCENHIDKRKSIRGDADAIISERALREIYLKVFEIYIKEGGAQSIMTAYNPVNGCWASSNYDLNTEILHNEWGYKGLVMTDWWGKMSDHAWADGKYTNGDKYVGSMIKAQNDIWMTCERDPYSKDGKVQNRNKINNFLNDIKSGYLTRAELQRSAVNICNFILKTEAFSRKYKTDFAKDIEKFYKPTEEWFVVEQAELGDPKLKEVTVGGRKIASFSKNVTEYKVYMPADATAFPEVKATAEEGTTVVVEQATKANKEAVVKATEKNYTKEFKIIFTDEEGVTPVLENAAIASLSDIKVNGKPVSGFDGGVFTYGVAVDSLEKEPEVAYTAPEGVAVKVTYDASKKATNIQCVTADQAVTYQLKYGIAPKSDEFNEDKLSDIWTIEGENKSNWKLEDGHLVIGAEYGSIWQDQAHLKNQFMQSAYGDWEAVVKVDLPKLPSKAYQSFGVVAMEDQDNYIYVKMEASDTDRQISLCQETGAKIETLETLSESDESKFTNVMYIKVLKLGNTYISSVSPDGKDYIRFATATSGEYENPKFMLVNGNGDKELSETFEAKFDYVQFKTEGFGDTVKIGADTRLKLAEVTPVGRSSYMKTAECKDTDGGLLLTNFKKDAYITYNVNVEKSGYYDVVARFASAYDNLQQVTFAVYADNKLMTGFFTGGTSGDQNWTDLTGGNAKLTAGEHKIKVVADSGGFNLNWLQFKLTKEIEDGELRAAVNAAKTKDMSLYSEEDRKKYAEAIAAAEKVLASTEDKAEFDAALKALREVEETLVVLGSAEMKAELAAAVEAAKSTFEAGQGTYADDVWKIFTDAYHAAANPAEGATTEELAQLKSALVAAVAALNPTTETNKPDDKPPYVPEQDEVEAAKTALIAAVEEAKPLYNKGQGEYVDDLWKDFVDAFEAAMDAVEKPAENVTVDDLDALTEALEDAKAALEKEPGEEVLDPETVKAELAEAVGEAKEIYEAGQENYTNSTWRTFKRAYEAAENALKDEETSIEDLQECLEDLEKAKGKLKKNTNADSKDDGITSDDEKQDPTDDGDVQDEQNPSNAGQNTPTNQQPSGNQQPVAQYMNQVQVAADKTKLYVGGDAHNTATVKVTLPKGAASQKITYSTSNTSIASVSTTGKVTARKAGNVTVKANVVLTNGETKEFAVNITIEKARIEKVKVQPTIKIGKKTTLRANVYGSSKRIVWKIKKGARYAKITKAGKLTAKSKGTVKVQAKAGKVTKTFTIRIK